MKRIRRVAPFCLIAVFCIICLTSCRGLTKKESIISLWLENKEAFLRASEAGDYQSLSKIAGIERIETEERCINIHCGSIGFGSGGSYFGIFYSAADDLLAVNVSLGSPEELQRQGSGFLYVSPIPESNKRYYVEPLGNHYFYYEAHY